MPHEVQIRTSCYQGVFYYIILENSKQSEWSQLFTKKLVSYNKSNFSVKTNAVYKTFEK